MPVRRLGSVDGLAGTACKTFDGAAGHVEIGADRDRPDHAHLRDGRRASAAAPAGKRTSS